MSPAPGFLAQHVVWPVGHGGFTTGQIFGPDGSTPSFTYVYDCGARHLSLLKRRIEAFAAMTHRVDLLFLSHLDADHVNGIEHLSMTLAVDTVVLPYLDRATSLMTAGAALAAGNVNWTLFDLLADPRGWAERRGIGSIVFVQRADGEGGPSPQTIVGEHGPESGGNRERTWWPSRKMENVGSSDRAVEARLLDHRSGLLHSPSPETTWVFVPHVPPVDSECVAEFLARVAEQIPGLNPPDSGTPDGPGLPFPKLAEVLRDPGARGRLKQAYDTIAKQHNAVSLSLFSGPLSPHHAVVARYDTLDFLTLRYWDWPHCVRNQRDRCGYLFTGDAPLSSAHDERSFFATYRHWIPRVHHAHVPHHGSWRSVSLGFFHRLEGARFVASAGSHSRKHPSPDVVGWATAAGEFCKVDERDDSRIAEHILRWP